MSHHCDSSIGVPWANRATSKLVVGIVLPALFVEGVRAHHELFREHHTESPPQTIVQNGPQIVETSKATARVLFPART